MVPAVAGSRALEVNLQEAAAVYFTGEKSAGLMLAAIALVFAIAAILLVRIGPALRPFGLTVGAVAVAEIALGVGLYLRTGPQVRRLDEQLRVAPAAFQADESARMARVQRNFVVIEYVELVLIIVAAVAAVALKTRPAVAGVALGFLVHGSLLLTFDSFAEHRGADYLAALARWRG